MGKPKVGSRPNEFKYGMALYGVAWPEGDFYFVCGGGGHGLQNRIVWAHFRNGRCSDQVGEYKLGEGAANTPMKMVMCPWGSSLLVGTASGGIRRLQIGSLDIATRQPKLVEVSAAFQEHLSTLNQEVSSMTFNHRGNLLAVGFKEGGGVQVLNYPSMRTLLHWRLQDPEVKDLDFVHTPDQPMELLATVGGDGSCIVWHLEHGQAQQHVQLETPKGVNKARFIRCRFARDGSVLLYVLINTGRDTPCYLAVYGPEAPGKPWQLLKKVTALDQPGSSFDISKNGQWLAAGDAEGILRVYDARTLSVHSQEVVSIAFVSSVVFNGDNTAVIAVGGDANCHVVDLVPRSGSSFFGGLLMVLLLALVVVAGAYILHHWHHPEALPYQFLQYIQQQTQQGWIQHTCSSGSSWLHEMLCSWAQRAAKVLPDEAYMAGLRDEL